MSLKKLKKSTSKSQIVNEIDDFDYYEKLSKQDQDYLSLFVKEFVVGDFREENSGKTILLTNEVVNKKIKELKKDEKTFQELKEKIKKENKEKRKKFPIYQRKSYDKFVVALKSGNQKDLDLYNRYSKKNLSFPIKLSDFEKPLEVIQQYKTLTLFEYVKQQIKNESNNKPKQKERCIMNRDYSLSRNVLKKVNNLEEEISDEDLLDYFSKDSEIEKKVAFYKEMDLDDRKEMFLEYYNNDNLKEYIVIVFEMLLSDTLFAHKDKLIHNINDNYSQLKKYYLKMQDRKFLYQILVLNMSLISFFNEKNIKGELLNVSREIDSIFNKIIFYKAKHKKPKKGSVL